MNHGFTMAQFTAGGTARRTLLQLGFIPDAVIVIANHGGTNPDILVWANKGGQTIDAALQIAGGPTTLPDVLSQWLDADDHLLITGSTGVVTRVTTGIKIYQGGETIAADETVSSNPVHPFAKGNFPKAGCVTAAGIELPAAILTNSAKYIVLAFRRDPDEGMSSLGS